MANGVVIPPWLNIDPVAPVGRYLEGYGLGQRAGEAQAAAAARQQQMAQQMAIAQQEAAYRQQQQALDAQQFNAKLRLEQERAQREAQEAAMQLEGMQALQTRTAAGEPFDKVWAEVAPKVLYRHPQSIAQAMERVLPPRPPTFSKGPGGVDIMQGPGGGATVIPPSYLRGEHVPRTDVFGGVEYIESSPGHWQPLQEQTITEAGRARLAELARDEAQIYRNNKGLSREEIIEDKPEMAAKFKEFDAEQQLIYSRQWKPGMKPATQELDDAEKKRLLDRANAAIERARQKFKGEAQQNAINEVINRLKALGINTNFTQPTNAPAQPFSVNPYDSGLGGF